MGAERLFSFVHEKEFKIFNRPCMVQLYLQAKSKQLEKENQDLANSQNDSKWFQGKIHDYQTRINELEMSQSNNLVAI